MLLQAAAVVGKVFWLGAVEAVETLTRWQAEEVLHSLERKEFVRRQRRSGVAGETEYAFGHVLIRDVAYSQIPRAGRSDLHERAAAWIQSLGRPEDHAEMLAHHHLQAIELAEAAGLDTAALGVPRVRRFATPATGRLRCARSRRPSASTTRRSGCGPATIPNGPSFCSGGRSPFGRSAPAIRLA